MNITVKIVELKVQTNYAKEAIVSQPLESILYKIDVPDNQIEKVEEGLVLTRDGINFLIRGLYAAILPGDEF